MSIFGVEVPNSKTFCPRRCRYTPGIVIPFRSDSADPGLWEGSGVHLAQGQYTLPVSASISAKIRV